MKSDDRMRAMVGIVFVIMGSEHVARDWVKNLLLYTLFFDGRRDVWWIDEYRSVRVQRQVWRLLVELESLFDRAAKKKVVIVANGDTRRSWTLRVKLEDVRKGGV